MIRVWSGCQGAVAVVILTVTAVWRGVLLKASYFNQDDYYLTTRAYHRSSLTWSFLFEDTAGHVKPAQQAIFWLVAHHAPFDWNLVAAGILVVELLTVVVAWHLLSRLLPGRWVRLPLLGIIAWSPITLVPTMWWTAAMDLWPPMLFLLLATLFFVRLQQRAGSAWLDLGACLLAVVLGLAWHERGILAVAVLAGVALSRSERRWWRRLPDAVVRGWYVWVPLGVVTVGYLMLHRALTSVESQQTTVGNRLDIVSAFVFRNTIPGLASGPWQAHTFGGAIVPARWVDIAAGLLALVVVVAVTRFGGPGRWAALTMLAAYVAGDVLLLLLGRAGFGEIIGLDPRYTADVVGATVVFTAVALEGAEPLMLRSWFRQTLAVVVAGLYLGGAAVTTAHLTPHFDNHEDRAFVTNLRADLGIDRDQVLVDRLAPPGILLPLLGKEALLSSVLAPLPEHPAFDVPSAKLRAVTDAGRLVEVEIVPIASSRPGPAGACGYPVKAGETVIPLTWSAPLSGRVVVRLQTFTDRAADYEVRVGSWTGIVHAVRGPQDLWAVVPGDAGALSSISITGSGPATLCVVRVDGGPPVPES